MQGVFQAKHPVTPYFQKILSLMTDSNIQQLTFCIKKCSVLQNLDDESLSVQDKICLDRCANKISFDVQLEQ